jgi:hypothetical protein
VVKVPKSSSSTAGDERRTEARHRPLGKPMDELTPE